MRFPKLAKRFGPFIIALVAALLAAGGFLSPVQAQQTHPVFPPVDHRARDAYWALRYGPVTSAEYQNAIRQGQALPRATSLPGANSTGIRPLGGPNPPSGVWTSIGPAPINSTLGGGTSAGRLAAVAIDPTTSGANTVIYIGTAGGGVWKSINNGTSWTALTDSQPSLAVGAIAVDPRPGHTNMVYVGTGESNQSLDNYKGSGILVSNNSGTTWTQVGVSQFATPNRSTYFSRIAVDARTGNVFAASSIGLYESTDSGSTWNAASSVPAGIADDVAINSSTSPSTIYTVIRFHGLYYSANGGPTWFPLTTGLPSGSTFNRTSIAIAPSAPSVMYLAISDGFEVYSSGTYNGGYYSNNGGQNWFQMADLNVDFTDGEPWYAQAFAVDPQNPHLVYGGGVNMWYTSNAQAPSGSNLWTTISDWANSSSLHADQHGIAFAPNCLTSPCTAYFANDGGLYTSSNPASQIYTDLNNAPLAITEFTGGDLGANFSTTASAK